MGFFSFIKKIGKKIFKGIKKVAKKAFKFVKKIAKSSVGKIIIGGAALMFGGGAISGLLGSAGSAVGGAAGSFLSGAGKFLGLSATSGTGILGGIAGSSGGLGGTILNGLKTVAGFVKDNPALVKIGLDFAKGALSEDPVDRQLRLQKERDKIRFGSSLILPVEEERSRAQEAQQLRAERSPDSAQAALQRSQESPQQQSNLLSQRQALQSGQDEAFRRRRANLLTGTPQFA